MIIRRAMKILKMLSTFDAEVEAIFKDGKKVNFQQFNISRIHTFSMEDGTKKNIYQIAIISINEN